ncbi:hypothetical protein Tco_0715557 [Tanacetum coccineum]
MTTLQFADTHNLVVFFSKPTESEGFEQIVDFLNANPIRYALMINPTIYTSCIEQLWATVKVKTVNGEVQLQALVDGKKIIITEASVRRDLQLNDKEGMDCLPNATMFEELTRMGVGKAFVLEEKPLNFQPMMVQAQKKMVEDEVVYEEMDDSLERVATTTSSLEAEQDSGTIIKTRSKATPNEPSSPGTSSDGGPRRQETIRDTIAQTRFENVSKHSNDPLLARGVISSDEASLGDQEDASKQGRKIDDIDKDSEITLVDETQRRYGDDLMFDTDVLDDEEVFAGQDMAEKEVNVAEKEISTADLVTTAGEVITTPSVEISTASPTETTIVDELTLVQTLIEIRSAKPKVKGVVIGEQSESITRTRPQQLPLKDKGKAIMEEPEKPAKRKDQIRHDEEVAQRLQDQLQAKLKEEDRLVRQREEEANTVSWDNVQAMIDADYQMAQQMQEEEQEKEKKEQNFFAAKRAKEKRNRTPTKAQQRSIMCTYLKNIEGWKPKDLFDDIQKLFDKAMKRVNTFVDMDTELVEGDEVRAEGSETRVEGSYKKAEELEQESSKKQKLEDDKEIAELKNLMEVMPDEEEVALDAIPLAVKSPCIVDWKIHKEGKKSYYQIIRADGSLKMYLVFNHMHKIFNKEDLETLYKLVKTKYGSTRPVEDLDLVLYGDLKTMFEPHVEDNGRIVRIKRLLKVTAAKLMLLVYKLLLLKITTAERVSTIREWIKTEEMIKIDWRSRLLTLIKKGSQKSKQETSIHKVGGSSEGANFESEVPDEPKGKSTDTSEGTSLKPGVPDVSTTDSSESENKSWGDSGDEANEQSDDKDEQTNDDHEQADDEQTESDDEEEETQDDEYVHTPDDYVPTDDETKDESNDVTMEEYERINEELYGDVNISLTDAEPTDKEKDDEEMTVAGHVNINQEGAGNQVKDDSHATQKTEVSVIPEHIVANPLEIVKTTSSTTISSLLSLLFPHLQQLKPIPTPTTTEATTSTIAISNSETLNALQIRVTNLEKDVKELKDVDNSTKVISTIQYEVPKAVKEYLRSILDDPMYKQYTPQKSVEDIREIKMEHARKQKVPKETITSSDTTALAEFDQKTTLFETMNKSKSFNKSPKQRSLYHALMESILEDEDAMDEGVTDKLKKRKQDDADKDKGPSAGSDRGLKRQKIRKDTEPSKKAKLNETPKRTSKTQPKSTSKYTQAEETLKSIDFRPPQTWISKISQAEKPPLSFDELMSTLIEFSAYVMNNLKINNLTQEHLVRPSFNLLKGTCRSHVELEYNIEECYKAVTDRLDWNNPEGKEYSFDLSKPLPLIMNQVSGRIFIWESKATRRRLYYHQARDIQDAQHHVRNRSFMILLQMRMNYLQREHGVALDIKKVFGFMIMAIDSAATREARLMRRLKSYWWSITGKNSD